MLREELPTMKQELEQDLHPFNSCDENMINLRKLLEANQIGQQPAWAGARVYIGTSRRSDLEQRGFYTVLTKDETLAANVSWLFCQLRDIMCAYLDYRNKYQFYGEMAEAVDLKLKQADASRIAVLTAAFDAAQAFREESQEVTVKYFELRQAHLDATEQFIRGA